jgi:hypothetical protein
MDDLVRTGCAILVLLFIAGAALAGGVLYLLWLDLQALSAGDTGFILASTGGVLILCACYLGAGLWLLRTGRI